MSDPTYTYEHGSGNARDIIRLLIPDPVSPGKSPPARFSDQEISTLSDQASGDSQQAAALGCEIIAMDEAKRAISVSVSSGMSISRTNRPTFWLQRAKTLREHAAKIPWETVDSMDYDVDFTGEDYSEYN